MKVFFIPFYKDNPYQLDLANALNLYGVEVKLIENIEGRIFPFLRTIVKNGRPDIIHLHWTSLFLLGRNGIISVIKSIFFLFELCILKLLGIRLVWTVHNLFNHEKVDPVIEKNVHHICCIILYDKIITLSSLSIEAIMHAYQLPDRIKNKISVVPIGNCINSYNNKITKDQARDRLGIENSKIVFLFFGLIRPYKGVIYLIEQFKRISDPKALLLIAGKPKPDGFKYEIESSCSDHNQIKTYLKFIPDNEIEIYMNSADIIIFPFQEILNSASLILAMSFGKAVISPNLGSIPEIIDEKGAFLYYPKNESGLLNAMNEALKSDLFSMGQSNYDKVKSFDWPTIANKTYEVYKQCGIKNSG